MTIPVDLISILFVQKTLAKKAKHPFLSEIIATMQNNEEKRANCLFCLSVVLKFACRSFSPCHGFVF